MAAMATPDGRWRVEAGGTGPSVVWYRLLGPDIDRYLPSMPALLAELERRGVDLAEFAEVATDVNAA